MCDWDNPITDYWLKYYLDKETGLCSLCGNTGTIRIETVKNPSGQISKLGLVIYCICPNGQSLRMNQSEDEEELKCCPMCGSEARKVDLMFDDEISHHNGVSCSNKECDMYQPFHLHDWQSRPLEDALQTALDATKASRNWNAEQVKNLRKQLDVVKEAIDEIIKYRSGDEESKGYWHLKEIAKKTRAEIEKIK